jgi:ATP-binding protein involved in chromosome partitioning
MFGNRKPQKQQIESVLSAILDCRVDNLIVESGKVRAILSVPLHINPTEIEVQAEQALHAIKGVKKVQLIVTTEKAAPAKPANTQKIDIDAKRIIAVASGKGGVGKSTVAMNLACGLANAGQIVGLLDADIYGPSVPKIMGLDGQKPDQNADGKIIPLMSHNVNVMSIGFMVSNDDALIWRGPMVQSAFTQMLSDVAWEGLDTLVIDLPPGTGDIQLTMAQRVPLTGAVVVSTPQDLALADARKAVAMFEKVNVPIIGLIENMSYHICEKCNHESHIFGHNGAKLEAEKLEIPFLGALPLNAKIREQADNGTPSGEFYTDIIREIMNAKG